MTGVEDIGHGTENTGANVVTDVYLMMWHNWWMTQQMSYTVIVQEG